MKQLDRRLLLKATAGGVALPVLGSLGCTSERPSSVGAQSQALTFPRRVIFFFTPQGNLEVPSSMDFTGSMLAPLSAFRDKMVVIRGLDLLSQNEGPGEPHQQGMALLTGRPLNNGTFVGGCGNLTSGFASGISIDQHIANTIGQATRLKTLNLGVQTNAQVGTEPRSVISYTAADQPVPNENSPWALFDRVFADLGGDPFGIERQRRRRAAILTQTKERFSSVLPRLGSEDRRKLERHLDSVRDVETRLNSPQTVLGGACRKPTADGRLTAAQYNLPENMPTVTSLQMDLLTMAMACDITRVATLQFAGGTNNRPYPFLSYNGAPITFDEHVAGHQPDTETATWGALRVIREWYMEQMASLMRRFAAVPEGAGTMLDNTVIVWCSEISKGNTHSHMNLPFLLCGGAGGAWQTGRMIDAGADVPHNNLLVSLMNAMGVSGNTFGDPRFCTGPLRGLV